MVVKVNSRVSTPGGYTLTNTNLTTGASQVYNYSAVRSIRAEFRDSVTTPGFPLGILPGNRYSYRLDQQGPGSQSWGFKYGATSGFSQVASGDYDNFPQFYASISSADISKTRDQLVTKVRLKVKDMKVNLAQAYAERAQTARTVGDAMTKLAAALRSARRGNFAKAARDLGVNPAADGGKGMASNWLALQYGWRPLLNDIHGAAETLAGLQFDVKPEHAVVTKTLMGQEVVNSSSTGWQHEVVSSVQYDCKISILYLPSLNTPTSVGLTNPALIAWELMPWSFVIDWALPIGDWISSWDATIGVEFLSGSHTESFKYDSRLVSTRVDSPDPYDGTQNWLHSWGNASCNSKSFVLERYGLTSFPLPAPPRFKDPFSLEHMLNAMALLRAQRR